MRPVKRTQTLQIVLLAAVFCATALHAADSPQFRGPERDGIFHGESGLLQSWPEDGPPMLWKVDGLGEGYSSVSVVDGRIYTTGKKGSRGSVHAFDSDGQRLWTREYGDEHEGGGYPGSRTTPTFYGGKLFMLSSMGQAVALYAKNGREIWRVDLLERFGGRNLHFGISESPLVLGDRVIYTPGGKKASIVALDTADGSTVWVTEELSQKSAYCNPRLFENGGRRQIVTLLEKSLVGVDPARGDVLWQQTYPATYDIHAVSPVFWGDLIYVSDGYGQGGKTFRLAEDGRSVELAWSEEKLDIHHGGAVMLDGRLYGAASKKHWHALDATSGEILATIPRLGKGALVYADGRLYGYVESGDVVLVDPDPQNFAVTGRMAITHGEGQHWAHPVISDAVLYIRHGDVLMAFDVRASAPPAASSP